MGSLGSEDRPYTAIQDPTKADKATTNPTAIFFIISTILFVSLATSSVSSALFRSISSLHHLTTSLWYRTRQANHYCSLWNCCSCSCTSGPEPQLGSRPPSHEFESGPSRIRMDTTLLSSFHSSFPSFFFFFFFITCITPYSAIE
jgi:hypothetical protein